MSKEIKIINYIFKYKDSLNMLSIEEYKNYNYTFAKLKLLIDNEYLEREIEVLDSNEKSITSSDLSITDSYIECFIGKYQIKLFNNNSNLINEYERTTISKNYYKSFGITSYTGLINEEEICGELITDYEIIKNIPSEYYKLYTINFTDFNGLFSLLIHDDKCVNLNLEYKDEEFKNKKVLNIKSNKYLKLSDVKLRCSGNYLWKIKLNYNKSFKSNPSIIPFKYQRSTLKLQMKKKLFSTDLEANSKTTLVITYNYK